MARIRSIKPEYWTSEQVMSMSRDARLLFIGLWNFSDDGGNHPASAITLKAEVLPGDIFNSDQVMALIDEMIEQGLLEEYESNGKIYWHITGWKHQRIDQPTFRYPRGDTGDALEIGDAQVTRVTKRLGGKQRQLVLRKLRERDGDACHLCGQTENLSIFSTASETCENPHEISLLRLICPTCKRNHKRGDTEKEQVTHGDTKGDSNTEWSGEERSGEEGKGSLKTKQAAQVASIVVGGDAPENSAAFRIGKILQHLRTFGINTSNNAISMHEWVNHPDATDELITAAVAKARQTKPNCAIHVNYLKPIIEELLNPPAVKPPKQPQDSWWMSNPGIERKGRELGMQARGTESYNDFKDRIFSKLREGGKAA